MSNEDGRMTERDWKVSVITPIGLLILTAFLTIGVGTCLQNRSFRRGEVFKAKLEKIKDSRKEAANLLEDNIWTFRQIRGMQDNMRAENSCKIDTLTSYLNILRNSETRVSLIKSFDDFEEENLNSNSSTVNKTKSKNTLSKNSNDSSETNQIDLAVDKYSEVLVAAIDCVENNPCDKNCETYYGNAADSLRIIIKKQNKIIDKEVEESEPGWIF